MQTNPWFSMIQLRYDISFNFWLNESLLLHYFPSLPCGHLYCPQMLFVVHMTVSRHICKAMSYHHNHQRVSNRGTLLLVAPLFRQKTHDRRNHPYRNQNCDKSIVSAGVLTEETNTSRAYKYYI